MAEEADRNSIVVASAVVFVLLVLWWVGLVYVDGALAMAFPYEQYSTIALLYPEIYYPGLPGWILAGLQPFSAGVYVALLGWMVVLSAGLGLGVARFAAARDRSPARTAVAAVVALYLVFTVFEAAATLAA